MQSDPLVSSQGNRRQEKEAKMTREEKYEAFKALHERPGVFLIPNPWNVGSAKILTALGFDALATTSAGFAFNAGLRDSLDDRTRRVTTFQRVRSKLGWNSVFCVW
jgi:2-methylisocitrate lyase-like PEP mutase family enzyme